MTGRAQYTRNHRVESTGKAIGTQESDELGQNSTVIKGDVCREGAVLKEQAGKNIAVLGSGDLVQTLIENDLVDEYSLTVSPIVVGSGKRLFRDSDQTRRLKLVNSIDTSTGSLLLTYQPA